MFKINTAHRMMLPYHGARLSEKYNLSRHKEALNLIGIEDTKKEKAEYAREVKKLLKEDGFKINQPELIEWLDDGYVVVVVAENHKQYAKWFDEENTVFVAAKVKEPA